MDYSKLTLGELLSSRDKIVRRNAVSILKQFQKTEGAIVEPNPDCPTCGTRMYHYYLNDKGEKIYDCDSCNS